MRFRTQIEYGQSDIENEYRYPTTHFMLMDETANRFCVVLTDVQGCARTVDIYQEAYRVNDQAGEVALPPVSLQNDGGIAVNPGRQNLHALFQANEFPKTYNPIKQMVSNGEVVNATLDATGRIGRTNFFTSVNQLRQEGSMKFLPGYTRNTVRMNIDQQLGGNFNVSFRTGFNTAKDYNLGVGFLSLSRQPANVNLLARDSKDRLYVRSMPQSQGTQNSNPAYATFTNGNNAINRIDRFTGSFTARWAPLSWLDGEFNFGYDGRNTFREAQTDKGYRVTSQSSTPLGSIERWADRSYSLNASGNLSARRNWFGDALSSRVTVRYLYEGQDSRDQNTFGRNLVVPGLKTPNAATQDFTTAGTSDQVRQVGFFTNVDLDYKGRYIVGALVRRDASSLFGSANRWATYGRASLAWRLSDESWFGFDNSISDLKFRYSIGQAGNTPRWSAQYETFSIGAGGVLTPQTLGNKNLKPEVSTETEIGMDLELFNRYGITLTHSHNVVDDQLLMVPPPAASGFSNQWKNAGQLTNNTFEASLNIPIVSTRNVDYSARINYDRNRSKITKLNVPMYYTSAAGQQGSETMFKVEQGARMGEIYGRSFVKSCDQLPGDFRARCGAGLDYQKNGDGLIVYVGQGNTLGDGIIKNLWMTAVPAAQAPWAGGTDKAPLSWGLPILYRDEDGGVPVVPIGQALPDYRWSLSQNFRYKRLSVYGLLDATVGKDVYNIARQWSFGDFQTRDADQSGKSVQDAKPIGYYFRAYSSGGIGGLYDLLGPNNVSVEDASFVKVRELTVGYRVGSVGGFGDWTVSVVGRNLFTFSDYHGFDPEVGISGGDNSSAVLNAIDAFTFPNLRTFTLSLSTSF